jgi:hypothetical protein
MRCVLVVALVAGLLPIGAAAAAELGSVGSPFQGLVRVHDHGGRVTAPSQIHPGRVEVANRSSHELLVVRRKEAGVDRLIADLRRGDGHILAGGLAGDFLIIDTLRPHAHVYAHLARGSYLVADRRGAATKASSDVAKILVAGSRKDAPIPAAADQIKVTEHNRLSAHDPTYALSALLTDNRGTHAMQLRVYEPRSTVTARQLRGFTAHPTWTRLAHLPVRTAFDLATLAAKRWASSTQLPSRGRYIVVAIPLLHQATQRPHLRRQLVASIKIRH